MAKRVIRARAKVMHEVGPGVAAIVKALRTRANLKISEVVLKSGVAASTISKIENGQLSPGYEIIVRLAHGLGVDVAELFRPNFTNTATGTGRRNVTRNGGGVFYDTANYRYEVLAPDLLRKEFVPLKAVIKARQAMEFKVLPSHEGEEFVLVLDGQVTLLSDEYAPVHLGPGDSIYFNSRSGHALISSSEQDATVVWICSNLDTVTHLKSGRS